MSEPTMKPTRVVHVKREPYDVYIGRGRCPTTGRAGSWGNPWSKRRHGLRACLEQFIGMIDECVQDPRWLEHARRELQGRVLGCWCKPSPCHGDILARLVDGEPWPNVRRWALDLLDELDRGQQLSLFAQDVLEAIPVGPDH